MQNNDPLLFHRLPTPGKIGIHSTKPCASAADLALAYTPGVAKPCLEIQARPETIYDYTSKGNMVAVISDGTAVLGLGNIGPGAGLPVMEGKAVLFGRFAAIDSIGLCLSNVFTPSGRTDVARVIETVQRLEPSFGGINLEDIAAPECFEVEEQLVATMNIPVFHDDQHGTAIICTAGVLNSLKVTGRSVNTVRIAVNGAGAAGLSCVGMLIQAGVPAANITLCDTKGVIYRGRAEGMNPRKEKFAVETKARTLADAVRGADVFLGLSSKGCLTGAMVRTMSKDPVIFAMANPDPEILPDEALAAGAAVVGTGRSDFDNQVNNVLGFPGIFRGALDVRARVINSEMKVAASLALAELAAEAIPADIRSELEAAYPRDAAKGLFAKTNPLCREYVIPKPFDTRVVPRVARKVVEAAVRTGVARLPAPADMSAYEVAVKNLVRARNFKF